MSGLQIALLLVVLVFNASEGTRRLNKDVVGRKGVVLKDSADLVEGDMMLRGKRAGVIGEQYRWPEGVVPYTLSPNYTPSDVKVITAAMLEVSKKTCVKFKLREDEENFIAIQADEACSSYVGMQGGKQTLSLARDGCMKEGIVVHELVHALGFVHEQERTDRDDFVVVHHMNVIDGELHNFEKYDAETVHAFHVPYDYNSIMHYGDAYFNKQGHLKTLVPKKKGTTIGQRVGLSKMDVLKIKRMYCPGEELQEALNLQVFGVPINQIADLFTDHYGTWSPTPQMKRRLKIKS